jgi:hypothetical protein
VTVPFLASTVSAFMLWRDLFGSPWLAVPMVAVVDILALTGLVLYIARVPSPFVPLRHFLPVVSVVPLGRELYLLLQHNGWSIAGGVSLVVIALFTWIAWKCFTTIEQLFISPVDAAREKTREQLAALSIELGRLQETSAVVDSFVDARKEFRQDAESPQVLSAQPAHLLASTVRHLAEGFVYILRSSEGYYKIGRAKDVQSRVRYIAAFVPFAVEVAHAFSTDNMVRLERGLQRAYEAAGKRINGEWFRLTEEDVGLLRSLGNDLVGDSVEAAIEVASLLAGNVDSGVVDLSDDPLLAKKVLAARLRDEGRPWREIAETVGRSPTTVRGWLEETANNGKH